MQYVVIISPFCLSNHPSVQGFIPSNILFCMFCKVRLFVEGVCLIFLLDFFIPCVTHPLLYGLFSCIYSRGKAVSKECLNIFMKTSNLVFTSVPVVLPARFPCLINV